MERILLIRSAARRHYSLVQLNCATAASIVETKTARVVRNFILNPNAIYIEVSPSQAVPILLIF